MTSEELWVRSSVGLWVDWQGGAGELKESGALPGKGEFLELMVLSDF